MDVIQISLFKHVLELKISVELIQWSSALSLSLPQVAKYDHPCRGYMRNGRQASQQAPRAAIPASTQFFTSILNCKYDAGIFQRSLRKLSGGCSFKLSTCTVSFENLFWNTLLYGSSNDVCHPKFGNHVAFRPRMLRRSTVAATSCGYGGRGF